MNMHGQMMNLPMKLDVRDAGPYANGYKQGHKDARHAAAEAALVADRRIDLLAEALVDMMAGMRTHDIAAHTGLHGGDVERLAEVKAWAVEHQRQRARIDVPAAMVEGQVLVLHNVLVTGAGTASG